jgi:hypothetical protein
VLYLSNLVVSLPMIKNLHIIFFVDLPKVLHFIVVGVALGKS